MKKTIIILNIGALTISAIWWYSSKFDFEPLTVLLGLSATLLGLLFIKEKKQPNSVTTQVTLKKSHGNELNLNSNNKIPNTETSKYTLEESDNNKIKSNSENG